MSSKRTITTEQIKATYDNVHAAMQRVQTTVALDCSEVAWIESSLVDMRLAIQKRIDRKRGSVNEDKALAHVEALHQKFRALSAELYPRYERALHEIEGKNCA
jgi:hypothetical protein